MRWRRFVRPIRANLGADVDAELRFHLEMIVQELVAAGMHPAAARAEAERRFGTYVAFRDACLTIDRRRHRRAAMADRMSALLQDIRYALRGIRLTPAFSFVVTITLALGIGATTTMYSVIDGVLLRPLPYDGAQLMVALQTRSANTGDAVNASFPEYADWKRRSAPVFADIGAWFQSAATLTDGDQPEMIMAERMSASVPKMLGVKPVIGRFFTEEEDNPAAPRTVVLGESFWRERFAADRGVIGRTLQLSGRAVTVIGVFPSAAAARLPNELASGRQTKAWFPLRLDEQSAPRGLHFIYVAAKRRPDVPLARANAAMQAVAHALISERVTNNGIAVTPMADLLVRSTRRPLGLLLGAVGLLLLISCANVANLLLARAATRQREFAIRLALGAARSRLVVQVLAESVVRALAGGALGVALAAAASWWLKNRLAIKLPRFELVTIDARVLIVALVASVATGLLFGIVPAIRAGADRMSDSLREGGRGLSGSIHRDRLRRGLIVAELALSFVLLAEAGLLIRSLRNVLSVPNGFDTSSLLSAGVTLPASSYPDSTRRAAFYTELLPKLQALPGAKGAALASALPIEGGTNGDIAIEGRTFAANASPVVEKRVVSAGYFELLGARAATGRLFNAGDVMGTQPVAIVNEAFVRRWMPNENPIGKRVDFQWNTQGMQTIVGVVADVREGSLTKAPPPAMYLPLAQHPMDGMSIVVRSASDPLSLVPGVRDVVRSIDAKLPVIDVRAFDAIIAADTASQRLTTTILAAFAGLALLLAAFGLYGVISYSVAQRTQEFGIRGALGAQRGDIMRLVLGQSGRFIVVGILAGTAGALAASRLIAAQLFGVGATDTTTFVSVAAVLAVVALAASAVPALRATKTDPLEALRGD